MQRRTFLRHLLAAPLAATTFLYGNPIIPRLREAMASSGKTLVVVFQRGGCDGLNTVIPFGDDRYYNLRPTIAISPPNPLNSNSAIDLGDGFFGLHPALKPLGDIYRQGDLAILPTVHYRDASRSHFDGQDFVESGVPGKRTGDGWLNRIIARLGSVGDIPAASFGSNLSHALRGDVAIPSFTDLSNFSTSHAQLMSRIRTSYEQPVNKSQMVRHMLREQGLAMFDNLDVVNGLDQAEYTPSNGAQYPDSEFGRHMRQISQLIKEQVGLEVATVSIGGWDTHRKQGGSQGLQANRHAEMASGVHAMYQDLGPVFMKNVLIVTMTEFGRTVKENANGGTDHGNASTWFAVGGSVNGGIHGQWPGLENDDLYLGRYLTHTVEFVDVFGEIISRHFGMPTIQQQVLPGHTYRPIGFL